MAIFISPEKLIFFHNESQVQSRITDKIISQSVLTSNATATINKRSAEYMEIQGWGDALSSHLPESKPKYNYFPV